MAVLVIGTTTGVTPEMHAAVLEKLGEPLRCAKGFIAHLAGPHDGGWRVLEIWESKEDATRWFGDVVLPNLPDGVKPKRTFFELTALVLK